MKSPASLLRYLTSRCSVATVDYDYSKAYGGGAASVVSSVGGTLGDTTRLTAENVGSTRAALGANVLDVRQQGGVHEEVIVIEAPPGYVTTTEKNTERWLTNNLFLL